MVQLVHNFVATNWVQFFLFVEAYIQDYSPKEYQSMSICRMVDMPTYNTIYGGFARRLMVGVPCSSRYYSHDEIEAARPNTRAWNSDTFVEPSGNVMFVLLFATTYYYL